MSNETESKARIETAALIRRYYEAFNKGDGETMLACLTDDDLRMTLEITELQATQVELSEVRADARRLAEESGSVGQIWDGQTPDDFEPIDGIGKVFEQRLYTAGIRTYRALADASPEQLAAIAKATS